MIDEIEFYLIDLKSRFNKIKWNEYYLSYSGGRDSHFLYWFIKEYLKREDIEIVACNTTLEHREIVRRMEKNADRILLPKVKPKEIKERYGIPCFSKEQDFYIYYYQNALRKGKKPSKTVLEKINGTYYTGFNISKKAREYVKGRNPHKITHLCCEYLKKRPFKEYEKETGKKAILGIRKNESGLRKQQYQGCFTKNKKFIPIYDLPEELLEKIIKRYEIEVPKIYKYVCRTGCMGCPYGSYKKETEKELRLLNKNQREYVIELFKESYEVLKIETSKLT